MAAHVKTLHTIDLNHRPSVMEFLSFMHKNSAKVIMYKGSDTNISMIAIVTIYRKPKEIK